MDCKSSSCSDLRSGWAPPPHKKKKKKETINVKDSFYRPVITDSQSNQIGFYLNPLFLYQAENFSSYFVYKSEALKIVANLIKRKKKKHGIQSVKFNAKECCKLFFRFKV